MELIKEKSLIVKSKINEQIKAFHNPINVIDFTIKDSMSISNEISYLKQYVIKCLRKEIFSIYFKQLISFNKSKFEDRYLLPITSLVERAYNKRAEFNFVNLKYLYLNSHIFSETLVTKLRNRKNVLLRVLDASLLMFKLPLVDKLADYEEIYNRKRKPQNVKIDDVVSNSSYLEKSGELSDDDALNLLLSKVYSDSSTSKLQDFNMYRPKGLKHFNYPLHVINTIVNGVRNKYVSGIRLEAAGRLTRRNTAERSVFKLRYKGNIKNMDSSYKGLSTVLLRGYAKSSIQYTKIKSKLRIGTFALKA